MENYFSSGLLCFVKIHDFEMFYAYCSGLSFATIEAGEGNVGEFSLVHILYRVTKLSPEL
jgi:hypothetical protein